MTLPFEAQTLVPSPSLATILAQKLRVEIESRRLRVGERFPTDAEIATAFGVSRTVVREAVLSLREAGLISTQRGRGSVVIANAPAPVFTISGKDLQSSQNNRQLFEFRYMVEVEAITLAASRRTEDNLASMRGCLDHGASAKTLDEVIEADIAFHLAVARATQNDYFYRILSAIRTATIARLLVRETLGEIPQLDVYRGHAQTDHQAMYDALVTQDAETAKQIMKTHLEGARLKQHMRDKS